jgi:hypothetical protein
LGSFGALIEFVSAPAIEFVRASVGPADGFRIKYDQNDNSVRSAAARGGDRRVTVGDGSGCQGTIARSGRLSLSSGLDAPVS